MKKISVFLAALALAGCSTSVGTKFDWANAKQVQVGTTEAELLEIMGKPYMVASKGDTQTWAWTHVNGATRAMQTVSFQVKNGAVSAIPTIPF